MTPWKLIKNPITGKCDVVWRELPDGRQESILVTTKEYIKWPNRRPVIEKQMEKILAITRT